MSGKQRSGADPYADLSRRTSEHRSTKGLWIVLGAVAVVLIVAIAAVALSGGEGDEPVDQAAAVVVEGEALADYPQTNGFLADPNTDPAVGATPPALQGQTFGGDPVTFDPAAGRSTVVIFAAHWCPHCQREIPAIQEWVDEGSLPDDVDLVLVSTDAKAGAAEYPPSEWLEGVGWSSPVLLDNADQDAARSYGLMGYPYMIFIDADGQVVQRASGALPIADFAEQVERIRA